MLVCECFEWEHELFDGQCPPPPPPSSCCGATGLDGDVEVPCVNGRCVEWFCRCGVFQQVSMGPVGCGCDDRPGWRKRHAEQRPKRRVPAGHEYTRRYRNRTRS